MDNLNFNDPSLHHHHRLASRSLPSGFTKEEVDLRSGEEEEEEEGILGRRCQGEREKIEQQQRKGTGPCKMKAATARLPMANEQRLI